MKYHKAIFLIGVWVVLVPFFGVPMLAKKILLVIPGAMLIVWGILSAHADEKGLPGAGITYADAAPDTTTDEVFSPIETSEHSSEESDV